MRAYSLSHLSDGELLCATANLVARERTTTAELIAHIAEVDARKLFAPAGYSSMHEYCVEELHLSEDAASKRLHVARKVRDFPALLTALADGRLHLTGACLLAPHLSPENVDDLLEAATHKTKAEIERLVAGRFPQPDLPTTVRAILPVQSPTNFEHAPAHVEGAAVAWANPNAPEPVRAPFPKLKPLAPERFALQVTIGQDTHDLLRQAQELLSHSLPSGDLGQVLHRALAHYVSHLEKRKFGATSKPRVARANSSRNPRRIPAHVRRAVQERDQGQCTFVSDTGHRCSARKFLELDHVQPVARGGTATEANLRLRCRSHNALEAERTYGAGFMQEKREAAKLARMEAQGMGSSAAPAAPPDLPAAAFQAGVCAHAKELLAGLHELGFRAAEARRAVEHCASIAEGTLEEHMRAALRYLAPRPRVAH